MRLLAIVSLVLVVGLASTAHAIDHKNLDEGRPLRLEDAYPIASGEWALEAGASITVQRKGPDRGLFDVEILYGTIPNLQVGLGSALSTDPREIEEPTKSGDLQLHALYNFNQETLTLPALGAKLTLNVPTGVDSSGVDVELKAIASKSFDRLSVHLNAAYAFLTGADGNERDGRYAFAFGASYPIGAPRYTRTTLVGDVFAEQGARRGDATIVGIEVGFRHQLTSRVVVDAGVGTEFAGPADRSSFFFTTGLSVGF
ncbi:MAG: transporter [Candidatus Rokuibacteriota bacterium]